MNVKHRNYLNTLSLKVHGIKIAHNLVSNVRDTIYIREAIEYFYVIYSPMNVFKNILLISIIFQVLALLLQYIMCVVDIIIW